MDIDKKTQALIADQWAKFEAASNTYGGHFMRARDSYKKFVDAELQLRGILRVAGLLDSKEAAHG